MAWHFLVYLFLLQGCRVDSVASIDPEMLKGHWSTACYCDDNHWLRSDWFSFEDSLCNKDRNGYQPYRITGDTIILPRKTGIRYYDEEGYGELYRVVSLTRSEMILQELYPDRINRLDPPIRLKRLMPQPQEQITRFAFYYKPFLRGEKMNSYQYIELDETGTVYMEGWFLNDSLFGKYFGKLDAYQTRMINEMASSIYLDTLRPIYAAHATHQGNYKMLLRTSTKDYQTEAYGFNGQPGALEMLIYKLLHQFRIKHPHTPSINEPRPGFTAFYANRHVIVDRFHDWHPKNRIISFRKKGLERAAELAGYEFEIRRDSTLSAQLGDKVFLATWIPILLDSANRDWVYQVDFGNHPTLSILNGTYRNGEGYPANHIYTSIDPLQPDTFRLEFIQRCYY